MSFPSPPLTPSLPGPQVAVGHPLDTVKVRLQSEQGGRAFTGVWDCIRKTVAQEGITGFYKGATPPLFMSGFLNGVMFSVNGFIKRQVAKAFTEDGDTKSMKLQHIVLSSLLTAPVYCSILTPSDVVSAGEGNGDSGGRKDGRDTSRQHNG